MGENESEKEEFEEENGEHFEMLDEKEAEMDEFEEIVNVIGDKDEF